MIAVVKNEAGTITNTYTTATGADNVMTVEVKSNLPAGTKLVAGSQLDILGQGDNTVNSLRQDSGRAGDSPSALV